MRRSSFIQLTLLPMLASAALAHADPVADNPPPAQPTYADPSGDAPPVEQVYDGPPGMAEPTVMPPGMVDPYPQDLPCDVDQDQPKCQQEGRYYWHGYFEGTISRGGFGGYFHGGGSVGG